MAGHYEVENFASGQVGVSIPGLPWLVLIDRMSDEEMKAARYRVIRYSVLLSREFEDGTARVEVEESGLTLQEAMDRAQQLLAWKHYTRNGGS